MNKEGYQINPQELADDVWEALCRGDEWTIGTYYDLYMFPGQVTWETVEVDRGAVVFVGSRGAVGRVARATERIAKGEDWPE